MWPHEVEPWFHSWYRGRVETLDAKYNLAYINSTLCGHTNSYLNTKCVCESFFLSHIVPKYLTHTHTTQVPRQAMTASGQPPLIGGFEYKYIDDPPDDLLCLICMNPARESLQNDCCGKIFCSSCLNHYKRKKRECPNCRKPDGGNFRDKRSKWF